MMTPKQEAALRLALETFERMGHKDSIFAGEFNGEITAIREALAEQPHCDDCGGFDPECPLAQPAQQQEPVAFPPVQFEKVAEGVEVGYDFLGGVDIRLGGEFVYVHINYDYRYTHNAARKALADQIVGLITTQPASKPWVGLTDEEVDECYYWKDRLWTTDELVRHVEAKLREKNAQPSKPLTDEQIIEMYNEPRSDAEMLEFARAIEAAHGIKGDA